MRSILSLSIPEEKKLKLEAQAREAGVPVSALILNSLDLVNELITESELISRAIEAEKNYKKGKTKKLGKLSDLMKK